MNDDTSAGKHPAHETETLKVESPALTHQLRMAQIDEQVLALLAERGDLVFAVASGQPPSGNPNFEPASNLERLEAIHKAWQRHGTSKFPERALDAIYREILGACASVVAPVRVAYLGPPGTFSHLAAIQAFGASPKLVECSSIANVFLAVERAETNFGIVPIENSIEGGVTPTHDSLLRSQLMICSEMILVVRLCLIAQHRDMSRIQRVYSHSQPLAQSRIWLSAHLPRAETIACASTTAAAQQAAGDDSAAAVTSALCAELYKLNVLAEGIEDVPGNATRFVTIAPKDAAPTGHDKTSVVFSTPDERGALVRILSIFDSEGLNLSRIESRPDRTRRWEYVFFTDVEGHRSDPALKRALERTQSQCQMVQILGSYPEVKTSNY